MIETDKIAEAMAAAAKDIAKIGVGKTGHNREQRFNFRPVDEVLNTVGPILAEHKIALAVEFFDREAEKVPTKSGGTMNSVTLSGRFTFHHAGQSLTTTTIGEARDVQDKATNKAMAMATKYALITAFAIPVVGADDADKGGGEHEAAGSLTIADADMHTQAIDGATNKQELRAKLAEALQAADAVGDKACREKFRQQAIAKQKDLPEE